MSLFRVNYNTIIRKWPKAENKIQLRMCSSKKGDDSKKKEEKQMVPVVQKKPEPRRKTGAQVTLLGANSIMGQIAALDLKNNRGRVSDLRLWDESGIIRGVAMDLSHIPTEVRVTPYVGQSHLEQALTNSDIVVVMGGFWGKPEDSSSDLFLRNAEYVRELSKVISTSSPKAMVGIAVRPITSVVAFFGELQKTQGSFSPNRLFGILSLEEMRTKSVIADKMGISAGVMSICLTGGGTSATLVPVISSANPGGLYLKDESITMIKSIRDLAVQSKTANNSLGPQFSAGIGVANFVRALAEGMFGKTTPIVNAVVRTSCLHGVPYLALPVALGPTGITGTSGIPKLNQTELRMLIQSLPQIIEDISNGETWAHTNRSEGLALQLSI